MELSELEKLISERNVLITIDSVILDINMLPPNGATIHTRNSCSYLLRMYRDEIQEGKLPNLTFLKFKEKKSERYYIVVETIQDAVNKLGVLI